MVKRPLDTASRIAFPLNTIPIEPDESQESLFILRFKTLSFLNLAQTWDGPGRVTKTTRRKKLIRSNYVTITR